MLVRRIRELVGSEGAGGQAFGVHQVGLGFLMPAETHVPGRGHVVTPNENRVALDLSLSLDELSIRTGDLEPIQRLAVTRGQTGADVFEGQPNPAPFDLLRLVQGPRANQPRARRFGPEPTGPGAGQPPAC